MVNLTDKSKLLVAGTGIASAVSENRKVESRRAGDPERFKKLINE